MEPNANLTTPLEADQPEEVKPSAPTPRRAGRTAAASPAASAVREVKPGIAVPKVEGKPTGLTDGLTSYYAFDESTSKPVKRYCVVLPGVPEAEVEAPDSYEAYQEYKRVQGIVASIHEPIIREIL